ncbi:MAG: hypothetical protein IT357_14225 [Gemmatimonadaceae bacterium]|nr:hypothetical protein [Gemmatimonadaceae bacterium]
MRHALIPAAVALLVVPTTTAAQVRPGSRDTVPTAMLPPAGKCRIWITGVAPAQQPAATDCPTALRQRSANSVILYGPPLKRSSAGRFDPAVGRESSGTTSAREPRVAVPTVEGKATSRDRERDPKAETDKRAAVRAEREREASKPAVKTVPIGTPAVRAEKPPVKLPPSDPPKKKPELP